MDQLVTKCRCRGTNAECHVCFGTGDVVAHGYEAFGATPVVAKPVQAKAPSKQLHAVANPQDLEIVFLRHAGLAQHANAQVLIDAMRLCVKRGQPHIKDLFRKCLKCARPQFTAFVPALAAAMRTEGLRVHSALVDINGMLSDGGSQARFRVDDVTTLASAWKAQTATNKDERRLAERIEQHHQGINSPKNKGSPPHRENSSSFSALRPVSQRDNGRARIEHVLVVSSGRLLPARVGQLRSFMAKHAFARIYLGGPKKALRELSKEFPVIDIVHVENPANLAFIRGGSRVAVFDLDSANG